MEECDPRIYLAAERTFLAWIRTGLALMGFGFFIARFGLFMRDEMPHGQYAPGYTGFSVPVGLILIVMGALVNASAALRHRRHIKALDEGRFRPSFAPAYPMLISVVLALIGIALAWYVSML